MNDSGMPKQLEKLQVSTGRLLIIDQFMLGNQQFLSRLPAISDGESASTWVERESTKIASAAEMYGGCLLQIGNGEWGVLREPEGSLFVIGKVPIEGNNEIDGTVFDQDSVIEAKGNAMPVARVFIDTRCLVFVDAAILANQDVLARYRSFRQNQDDKGARDLIRENGAAVRYGFGRDGDELGVFRVNDGAMFALWPDVVDSFEGVDGNKEIASEY